MKKFNILYLHQGKLGINYNFLFIYNLILHIIELMITTSLYVKLASINLIIWNSSNILENAVIN